MEIRRKPRSAGGTRRFGPCSAQIEPCARTRESCLLQRCTQRGLVIQHQGFDDGQGQASVAYKLVVKRPEAKRRTLTIAIATEQPQDLPLAGDVRDLLRG